MHVNTPKISYFTFYKTFKPKNNPADNQIESFFSDQYY